MALNKKKKIKKKIKKKKKELKNWKYIIDKWMKF